MVSDSAAPSEAITIIGAMVRPALFIVGAFLLLGGGACMVAESRLSIEQIQEEIRLARTRVEEQPR
jgi:hypothetical protein